jgi:hypothetical protein
MAPRGTELGPKNVWATITRSEQGEQGPERSKQWSNNDQRPSNGPARRVQLTHTPKTVLYNSPATTRTRNIREHRPAINLSKQQFTRQGHPTNCESQKNCEETPIKCDWKNAGFEKA